MTNHWISMGVPNVWVIHAAHQGFIGSIRPDFAVGEMFVGERYVGDKSVGEK